MSRRLGGEFGIGADAPAPAPLQMDAMAAQHPPHMARRNIPQGLGHQASRPGGVARRRRLVQPRQYAPLRRRVVAPLHPRSWRVGKAAQPSPRIADPPFAHRRRPHPQGRGDLQIASSIRRLKDDPRPQRHALLRLRRPDPLFQRAPGLFPNRDGVAVLLIPHHIIVRFLLQISTRAFPVLRTAEQ